MCGRKVAASRRQQRALLLAPRFHLLILDAPAPQNTTTGQAKFVDNHTVKYSLPGRVDVGGAVTAKDIIIATGSVPFVPPGARGCFEG